MIALMLSPIGRTIGVLAALVAATVAFGWWSYHRGQNAEKGRSAAAEGRAAVSAGQAAASGDAAKITDAAVTRDRIIERTHEINRQTIITAPGADAPLDRELLRRARVGLCGHAAYAGDPGCAELRAADRAVLPPAGSAGRPPSP